MQHDRGPAATVERGTPRSRGENAMAIEEVGRVFIYVVLGAATLLATLAASSRSTALRPAWCGDGPRRAVEEE